MIANFTRNFESRFISSTLVRLVLVVLVVLLSQLSLAKDEGLNQKIDAALAKMTLEQKVGQLFILGFPGTTYPGSLKPLLEEFQPGAIIEFSRNISEFNQVAKLNQAAQVKARQLNGVPLFIMLDQEGGAVARIKTTPPVPSALSMGETDDLEIVRDMGRAMGEVMGTLGFNMNLAPVLDIGTNGRKSFIANRAFASEPQKVADMSLAFSEGLISSSIMPTAKHFPGHGGLVQDSHKSTPKKLASLEELEKSELLPFKLFTQQNRPVAIMVAHVAYPNVDPSGLPAAFSSKIIDDVLRQNLGYDGLVVTDDIEMMGANAAGTVGGRAIKAIDAGCDMVMVAWSPARQKRAYQKVLQAFKSGRLTKERLDQSVRRILRAKFNYANEKEPDLKTDKLPEQLAELKVLTEKIHRLNFEKSFGANEESSKYPNDQKVLIFSADDDFVSSFRDAAPNNPVKSIRLTPKSLSNVERFIQADSEPVAIYYATGTKTAVHLNGLTREVQSRIIVVNGAYPGAIENPSAFKKVIDLNSADPASARWLVEKFFEIPQTQPVEERLPAAENEDSADDSPPPGS